MCRISTAALHSTFSSTQDNLILDSYMVLSAFGLSLNDDFAKEIMSFCVKFGFFTHQTMNLPWHFEEYFFREAVGTLL